MQKVFVSGCYDILHGGHIQFFEEARALGDHLTVSFASEEVLWIHKRRKPSIPDEHKKALLEGMRVVDQVVIGDSHEEGLDFKDHFLRLRPNILAVTEDDKYGDMKRELCAQVGAKYVLLPKTPPRFEPVSTSSIVRWVQAPSEAPLRVDFAGGWLDYYGCCAHRLEGCGRPSDDHGGADHATITCPLATERNPRRVANTVIVEDGEHQPA